MRDLMEKYGMPAPLFPMNAQDSKKKKEKLLDDDNYVAEIKYDGARYLCWDGRFFSRVASVSDGMPTERTANVPHLHRALSGLEGMIIDGEVYYPGKKSNHVASVMGCSPEKAIDRQSGEYGLIRYVIYDILMYNGEWLTDLRWLERRKTLLDFYGTLVACGVSDYIDLSRVATGDNKRKLLETITSQGGEGIMLKNRTGLYYSGARPTGVWFKVKTEITYDVVVIGYEEGQGKYAGQVGAVVFGLYKDGVLTECGRCSGMTDALRREITDNQQAYLNRVMEIEAMERTEKGMFRHPRFLQFRDPADKSPAMCQWESA